MALYRKQGKWYIDFYYQGRRVRECIGTSKRRAQKALDTRKGEIVQGRLSLQQVKPSPLLEEFAEEFLRWAKANCRAWEGAGDPLDHRAVCLLLRGQGPRADRDSSRNRCGAGHPSPDGIPGDYPAQRGYDGSGFVP